MAFKRQEKVDASNRNRVWAEGRGSTEPVSVAYDKKWKNFFHFSANKSRKNTWLVTQKSRYHCAFLSRTFYLSSATPHSLHPLKYHQDDGQVVEEDVSSAACELGAEKSATSSTAAGEGI